MIHLYFFSWSGYITWGVCVGDIKVNSIQNSSQTTVNTHKGSILISSSESQPVKDALSSVFDIRHIAGAGYKLLGVCQNLANGYILTKSSNYKWDCCGPHAILRSMGGGIVKYSQLYKNAKSGQNDVSVLEQLKYHVPDHDQYTGANRWCNHGGIVAYKTTDLLEQLSKLFKSHDVD